VFVYVVILLMILQLNLLIRNYFALVLLIWG
jgi:hypothetical protein